MYFCSELQVTALNFCPLEIYFSSEKAQVDGLCLAQLTFLTVSFETCFESFWMPVLFK